jgi:hypothetical protein
MRFAARSATINMKAVCSHIWTVCYVPQVTNNDGDLTGWLVHWYLDAQRTDRVNSRRRLVHQDGIRHGSLRCSYEGLEGTLAGTRLCPS